MALKWLLLCSWQGVGHKMANHHFLSCHHVFTSIRFDIKANRFGNYFLGSLNGCFGFKKVLRFSTGLGLNGGFRLHRHVCLFSTALRHAFS